MHEHSVISADHLLRKDKPDGTVMIKYQQRCPCGATRTMTNDAGERKFDAWDEPTRRIAVQLRTSMG